MIFTSIMGGDHGNILTAEFPSDSIAPMASQRRGLRCFEAWVKSREDKPTGNLPLGRCAGVQAVAACARQMGLREPGGASKTGALHSAVEILE
jgi:hypothetical protein